MKSLHDYRGEYAAACRRYKRAFNRWRRGAGSFDETTRLCRKMFEARDRYHARLNTPKRKGPSKRARRRATASSNTQLYHSVRDLASYAVRGGELDAPVQEFLVSLIPCYSAAVGDGTRERDVDGLTESQPTTSLGLVIAAAVAREALAQGKRVTPAQLAVLGGLDRARVLQLITAEPFEDG